MAEDKILAIAAKCGETTCASEPGKFCEHKGTVYYGTKHVCRLFPSAENAYTVLEEKDGWLLRCEACLIAERINNINIAKAKQDALNDVSLHKFKG
jgi:hypothetical protein